MLITDFGAAKVRQINGFPRYLTDLSGPNVRLTGFRRYRMLCVGSVRPETPWTFTKQCLSSGFGAARVRPYLAYLNPLTLCYTIVLPGRRSDLRAGFRSDDSREHLDIGPPASLPPAGGPISCMDGAALKSNCYGWLLTVCTLHWSREVPACSN